MKRILLTSCLVLIALIMVIGMTSCGFLFGDDEEDGGSGNVDHYGYERPTKCWITDVLLLNNDAGAEDLFGDGGESGLLSGFALEEDGKDIAANQMGENFMGTSRNYLVCLIYGDLGSYSLNLETYLKFSLINGTQVLYDEECVKIGNPYIHTVKGDLDVDLDMSKTPDGRLTFTASEEASVVQACLYIPFELLQEGTLYADLRVDCVNISSNQNSYVDRYAMAEVGEAANASTQASVNSFSAKYLTEQAYHNGSYSDADMTAEPSFKDGAISYMVMDFEFAATQENDGKRNMYILVRVPEAEVMDATIEEAPTGKIEESVTNNVTSIYASYSVPPTANEVKKVRMVVRLKPLNEGVAYVDVFLVGGEGVRTDGNNYISTKLVSGVPTLRYTLSKDKTYYTATALWHAEIEEVIVPDTYLGLPVKGISSKLLKGNTKMTSLVIGNNVTSLSANEFEGCTSLATVTIGNGVTQLPSALFKGCTKLRTVTLPEGIKSISGDCFSGCSSLTAVKNVSAVTSIGSSAFSGCSSLKSLTCGEITSLGSSAFYGCTALTAVNTVRVKTIPKSAFEGCASLQNFDLTGVTVINSYAFSGCKAFTQIVIPDGEDYVRLSEKAFLGTSGVKSLYIGKNTGIEHPSYWGSTFDLTSLESITVSPEHESLSSEGNCLVYRYVSAADGTTQLATVYLGCKNSVIPNDVTYINTGAFRGCVGLTSITLPAGLKEIDRYAFANCTGLTQITIPSSVYFIWQYAFEGCTALEKVNMPSGTWYAANSNHQNAVKEVVRFSSAEKAAEILTETNVDDYIVSSKYYN